MNRVLIDTGPLVAISAKSDAHHTSCLEALRHLEAPLLTCWPVITESAWLLRHYPQAVQKLLRSVTTGFLELLPLSAADVKGIVEILQKYADLKPQLADAAIVHLADREGLETIFTLDKRDFAVYRSGKNRRFRIIPA